MSDRTPFSIVGRAPEQAEITAAIASADRNEARALLVGGEAGVGKTFLVSETLADRGVVTFSGRARQDGAAPFAPIASAVRQCLRADTDADRGPLTPWLAILAPELGQPAERTDPDLIAEAVGGTLADHAAVIDAPVALFLDDLQWADNATVEVVAALADRVRDERVLIMLGCRTDDLPRGHAMRRLRDELRRSRLLQEIPLTPFDATQTAALVEALTGSAPAGSLTDLLMTRAGGVPLLVSEIVANLHGTGCLEPTSRGLELVAGSCLPIPESYRDAVLLQLDALDDDARDMLDVAAVVGTEFDLGMILDLAGSERGVDQLLERGLIRESGDGDRAAFRQTLAREVVLGEIRWTRRRSLHRQVAAALADAGAVPDVIAHHWLEARETNPARLALLEAARRSCELHAHRDAVASAQQALEIWPDGEDEDQRLATLQQLAECARIAGLPGDAVPAWQEMIESETVRADLPRYAGALRGLAGAHMAAGNQRRAADARAAAVKAFRDAGLPAEAAVESLAAASQLQSAVQLSTATDSLQEAVSLASEAKRDDLQSRELGLLGSLMAMRGRSEEGLETVQSALNMALSHNIPGAAAEAYRRLAQVFEYTSDFKRAQEAYSTAMTFCESQGEDRQARLCTGCMAWVLMRCGDFKRAIEVCRTALRDAESPARTAGSAMLVLGTIHAIRGEIRQARRLLREVRSGSRADGMTLGELLAWWGLSMLAEIDGDRDAILDSWRQMLDLWTVTEDRHDILPALLGAVTAFAMAGESTDVTRCTEAITTMAGETGNPEADAVLQHGLGEAALLAGRTEEAVTHFQSALDLTGSLALPLERLRIENRLGLAQVAAGDRESGLTSLRNAYRAARKLSARPLSSQIADEIQHLGETVEERRRGDATERRERAGLTRRQLEVALLVADGLTNKEIARRLFLSPRTVDMHVANVLDRLDCRGRSEAGAKLADAGLQ